MSRQQIFALGIFGLCYVGMSMLRRWRVLVVWAAAFLLVALGALSPREALAAIDWNVLGLVVGSAILARLFSGSGATALVAGQIAARTPNARMAVLSICFVAGFLSSWMDNIATVLIIAPVAFAIAGQLEVDPAPIIVGLTLSANLRGAATLIGDATSMILASYSGMTFNDFFWFLGRPGLFFVVQVAGMAAVLVLQRVFRALKRRKVPPLKPVALTSWAPTILLIAMIAILAATHLGHLRTPYLSGMVCLGTAAIGLAHHYLSRARRAGRRPIRGSAAPATGGRRLFSPRGGWRTTEGRRLFRASRPWRTTEGRRLFRASRPWRTTEGRRPIRGSAAPATEGSWSWRDVLGFEWRTVALIAGLFVVARSLSSVGLTSLAAREIEEVVGSSFPLAFLVVLGASVLLSGVVGSIPYVTTLVPVVAMLGSSVGTEPRDTYVLLFALLIGSSVGGNMIPIGASTSIVAVGMLERSGTRVKTRDFLRIGAPYTVVAAAAAAVFIWVFWRLIP